MRINLNVLRYLKNVEIVKSKYLYPYAIKIVCHGDINADEYKINSEILVYRIVSSNNSVEKLISSK